ncbi:MAG: hypothetical protein JOY79_04970 [Acidobacteriaceae bacterium]|nr:hypothetical protein [Acidobacteriaceae bacterium]
MSRSVPVDDKAGDTEVLGIRYLALKNSTIGSGVADVDVPWTSKPWLVSGEHDRLTSGTVYLVLGERAVEVRTAAGTASERSEHK